MESFSSEPAIASSEPCTSDLTTTGSSLAAPAAICENICSSVPRAPCERRLLAPAALAVIGDVARAALVLGDDEIVARERRAVEAQHLDRHRRAGLALMVWPRSSTSARTRPHSLPATKMSPTLQRAALDQHGRDRAAAALELRLDARRLRPARFGIGLEVEDFGLQQDRLFELVEAGLLGRRDFDVEHVAAHLLDDDLVLQQFLAHAVGLGVGLVDLVDGDDDRRRAALAWRIASTVCSLMPSSAATTSTTMSVTLAPRARIAVKA